MPGATEAERPYFVMELVRGIPILGEELKKAPNRTDFLELQRTFQEWRSKKIPDQTKH